MLWWDMWWAFALAFVSVAFPVMVALCSIDPVASTNILRRRRSSERGR
jgi:hypothetical protein